MSYFQAFACKCIQRQMHLLEYIHVHVFICACMPHTCEAGTSGERKQPRNAGCACSWCMRKAATTAAAAAQTQPQQLKDRQRSRAAERGGSSRGLAHPQIHFPNQKQQELLKLQLPVNLRAVASDGFWGWAARTSCLGWAAAVAAVAAAASSRLRKEAAFYMTF